MLVVAFVAYEFVDYVVYLLPGLPERGVASSLVLGPAGTNPAAQGHWDSG